MSTTTVADRNEFAWKPQPQAAALVRRLLAEMAGDCPAAAKLASRFLNETGTRLVDWVDHLAMPRVWCSDDLEQELAAAGFVSGCDNPSGNTSVEWRHAGGLFPAILTRNDKAECEAGGAADAATRRLAIKVDAVDDFVTAQRLDDVAIVGEPGGRFRTVVFASEGGVDLMAVERHGYRGFSPAADNAQQIAAAARHSAAFDAREREHTDVAAGFANTETLIVAAVDDIGADWACDLFFASERKYWQGRNHAGQVQKARQDALGVGWGNHDHHTYRSSRVQFTALIAVLEQLSFVCRERFYAGEEAGWGAQVLEHPICGIAIFADVDLLSGEIASDFAHEPLAPLDQVGTIGLWCALHGEAFLDAGLHHLESQFDFTAVREQLASEGIETMAPFTDMPHLKQAFTEGEWWRVEPSRMRAALAAGLIDADQAEQFRESGVIGSHLEILQRNDGYKGFNQTGISQIIRETDPRS